MALANIVFTKKTFFDELKNIYSNIKKGEFETNGNELCFHSSILKYDKTAGKIYIHFIRNENVSEDTFLIIDFSEFPKISAYLKHEEGVTSSKDTEKFNEYMQKRDIDIEDFILIVKKHFE